MSAVTFAQALLNRLIVNAGIPSLIFVVVKQQHESLGHLLEMPSIPIFICVKKMQILPGLVLDDASDV